MRTRPVTFAIPSPAAGADWTYTPSNTDQAVIMAVSGLFTSSVAVANRLPALVLKDQNGVTYFADDMSSPQTASLGCTYTWAPEAPNPVAVAPSAGQKLTAPFPNVWMQPGDTIGSLTHGIDVADQWSAVVVRFYTGEHWKKLQRELREAAELEQAISALVA